MTTAIHRLRTTTPPGFLLVPTGTREAFDAWAAALPRRRSALGQPPGTLDQDVKRLAKTVAATRDERRQWLVAIPDEPYHQSLAVVAWIVASRNTGVTVADLEAAAAQSAVAAGERAFPLRMDVYDIEGRPALIAVQAQAVPQPEASTHTSTIVFRCSALLVDAANDAVVHAEMTTADLRLRDLVTARMTELLASVRPHQDPA